MVMTLSILAAIALGSVICALLMGWGGLLNLGQRLGLAMTASGLVLAAIPRFQGHPPGWGDVLMLLGLTVYLGSTYGPKLFERADGLDGAVDGRISAPRSMQSARTAATQAKADLVAGQARRQRGQP